MKFLSALALSLTASSVFAQATDDTYEMAGLAVTTKGYDCDQVLTVTPTSNENVLEINCKKSAGSNAEVVYIFTIDGAGFSITPK